MPSDLKPYAHWEEPPSSTRTPSRDPVRLSVHSTHKLRQIASPIPRYDSATFLQGAPPRHPPTRLQTAFDALRNLRHIFTECPEEIEDRAMCKAGYNADNIEVSSSWGNYNARSRFDAPDPDFVRVRLFQQTGDKIRKTHLYDDVPVCHTGKVNFNLTKRRWRLQNITVVDTDWEEFVELKPPYTLSSETLGALTNEYQRLYILERPSPGRELARRSRMWLYKRARTIHLRRRKHRQ